MFFCFITFFKKIPCNVFSIALVYIYRKKCNSINMKMIKWFVLGFGLVFAALVLNSCNNDDGYSLDKAWYSIATVNPSDDSKSFWLSLDSGTSLWPVATNIPGYNPKEKQRAFVIYSLLSDEFYGYDHAVKILDLKSILTKPVAENLGKENDDTYGTDPVDIAEMWIGDGYLNIVFEFNYGGNAVHYINLLASESPDTPYSFEFRHHAYNDSERYSKKGIAAFDLSSINTRGEEVELLISVNTFEGSKQYSIKYNSSTVSDDVHAQNYLMESFIETK